MAMAEMLNAAGAEFDDGAQLRRAIDDMVAARPTSLDLVVDGRLMRFRRWSHGRAWAAAADLPGHHTLYVIARNVDPATITLTSDIDVRDYLDAPLR